MRTSWPLVVLALAPVASSVAAAATEGSRVQNPYAQPRTQPVVIDVAAGTVDGERRPLVDVEVAPTVRFEDLDEHVGEPRRSERATHALPDGLDQIDDMVVPEGVRDGALMVGDAGLTAGPDPQNIPADSCAYPDEVPAGIYEGDSRKGGEYPRRGTIYLNFTGGVLSTGAENSAENKSQIARTGHEYPAFTGGEPKAVAVAQAVQADFAAWALRVVYETRPRKLVPYTMAMVGGHYTDTSAGASSGVAPIDCEDFGQRNVCYSFTNTEPATSQANVVSQEVAHTYGLEHTFGADRIMSYEGGGDKIFGSNCQETFAVQGQSNGCQGVNKCHCGDGDFQNDSATIGIIYAPAGPDEVPPTIELTYPPDGSVYQVGEDILVGFEPWDDYGGYGWKLVIEDEAGEVLVDQVDYDRALEFKIVGLDPGTYTFTGEIEDQADQITTHSITIVVEGEAADTMAGSDESGDGGSASAGDSDGDGESGDDDAQTDGSGEEGSGGNSSGLDDPEKGCACASDRARPSGAALVLVGLASLKRRRRTR